MGQKVNPIGIRLGITREWSSRWYAGSKSFASNIHTDFLVRKYLNKKLADASGMNIQLRRTEERAARNDMLPYSIDVVCLDQTGIVAGLTGFFTQRGVDIAELSTRSYAAAHTGAPMFSVQMIVNVPSRLHIGVLREEFMDFCDHLNLDAIFEPVKS